MTPQLHHLIGNAIEPIKKPSMIIHVCNDIGGWGRGFVLAISQKYPKAEKQYRDWFSNGHPSLGEVQFVQVTPETCVANMIAQHGIRWQGQVPPIRYEALETCLKKSYEKALQDNLTVASPRIGCVLAGGSWDRIEAIIKKTMTVDTYVYTLEKQKNRWPTKYEN
ncbi:MAG: macro domain-containing protein [Bacteroidetes bacterium]|nr:macro domain-containing protein [Bacteroidota bacterium]